MTNLASQRRLAAEILKVGQNRVWIDPERMDDVEGAITREEVKKLIHEKVIVSLPEKGVSRSRAKTVRRKKSVGRRKGPGSRTGSGHAKISKKEAWMSKIRSLRRKLRELKANRVITESTYRKMYGVAGSGRFESVADLERYLRAHDLWRKR
jgi:large subunit ribosomal protein L19e